MKLVKFRGLDKNGIFKYGYLSEEFDQPTIGWNHYDYQTGLSYPLYEYVDPDTVSQFLGYDENGEEVYEGDTLVDENGIAIELEFCVRVKKRGRLYEIGDTFYGKLKGR